MLEARTTTPALRVARFVGTPRRSEGSRSPMIGQAQPLALGMSWEEVRTLFLDHRFYLCDFASLERLRTYLTRCRDGERAP